LRGGAEVTIPLGHGIAGKIAVSGDGLIFDDVSRAEAITSFLRQQLSSLVGVPLKADGRVIGVIHAGTRQPRKFVREDLDLIRLVGDRAASAIERARLLENQRLGREAAEASNRAKDEFLAMLGHELRNPLHAILLAVRLLETRVTADKGSERAWAIIARQAAHVTRLVDDLLDVARVTSGRIVLVCRPVNFAERISECIGALRETGQLDRHTVQIEAEPVWIYADPDRIIQIVTNLLGNALKYTASGGNIRINLKAENQRAVLRIEDDGTGIASAFLPHIFDLFARGQGVLERAPAGLGVGLTLVKSLVELHRGTVEAASGGRHKGSTFVSVCQE
jgi:signal transduction histidine kinase